MNEGKGSQELERNLEDTVGVSFRAFRTIRDLFIRPNVVFRAYEVGDTKRYTPALKVWFMLQGVYFTFVYFFGGINKAFLDPQGFALGERAKVEGIPPESIDDFIMYWDEVHALIYVPVLATVLLLVIPFLKKFNRELETVSRVNISFAILSPALLINIAALNLTQITPVNDLLVSFATWTSYFLIFFLGAKHWFTNVFPQAFFKSLLFALTLIVIEGSGIVVSVALTTIASYVEFAHD
jgi:hypothetical protein